MQPFLVLPFATRGVEALCCEFRDGALVALWAKVYVFAMNNDDVDPTPYTQTDLSIITQYKCENLRVLSTFFFLRVKCSQLLDGLVPSGQNWLGTPSLQWFRTRTKKTNRDAQKKKDE